MHYIEFKPMDEKEMIEYLGDIEYLEKMIPEMLADQMNRLQSIEECISTKSIHSMNPDEVGSFGGGADSNKVYHILMSVYDTLKEQSDDIALELLQITEAQRKLEYVEQCIKMLPRRYGELIVCLFVKKIKRSTYAKKIGYSEGTVFRWRNEALKNLLDMYNSRFSDRNNNIARSVKKKIAGEQ